MAFIKGDMRPIMKYLRPHKKAIWATAMVAVLEMFINLTLPLFYGRTVDLVIQQKAFSRTIFILLLGWAALSLTAGWLRRVKEIKAGKFAYAAHAQLITKSIEHLINLPLRFHKHKKIGEIIQRFNQASDHLYQLAEGGLFFVLPNLLAAFLAFLIIFWLKWQLAVIYLCFIFLYIAVTIKRTVPVIEYQKKINLVFEKIYGDIFNRTPNIISIKSNTAEAFENQRNSDGFNRGFAYDQAHLRLWMNLSYWQNIIFVSSFVVLFGLGIYYVSLGEISIGQFVMLLSYINLFSGAISMLGGHYKRFQEAIVTINRADKIFSEVPEDYNNPQTISRSDWQGTIEFKNVSFDYEKQKVLSNVSFTAQAGKIVAIIGRSGEGKTTLVDLISRYIIPQKGKIFLDGIDINKINLKNLRDQIAIVPQEIDLFNDTIKNNIGYSRPGATDQEIIKAAKLAYCHEFIEGFAKKYNQVVGERGVKLSTGQKQRVAIARAILRDPKILILDEATSALDSQSEQYVQKALNEVMKNRTTFVIAHRLSTIRRADLILVLENGRIVESGTHQELINHGGVYQKLSRLQQISF